MAFRHNQEAENAILEAERLGFNLTMPPGSAADAPLIVLLGWFGAKDRFLSKYSQFLNEAGYPTLRAICPPAAIFWPHPAPRRRFAATLLRFLAVVDEGAPARPIIFYAFSNGGGFVITELAALLQENNNAGGPPSPTVAGVIFDSAPCYMHLTTGIKALGEGRPLIVRVVLAFLFLISVALGFLAHPYWPRRYWHSMEMLKIGNNGGKYLYLYSHDDPLCDSERLTALIAGRVAAGLDVHARGWERSGHVAHYRFHPEEYKELVLEFVKEAAAEVAGGAAGVTTRSKQSN